MAKFKVLDVRKIPSPEDSRIGRLDHLVTYQLDPFRTYMVRIPKDSIEEKDIVEAVRTDLEGIERFTGKEFST
jgi:uncharacterized protein YfaT (DUF1175 family)